MKTIDKPKAFVNIRKHPMGSFAPDAPASFAATKLHLAARCSLWKLLFFLLLSIAAWCARDSHPLNILPASFSLWLGAAPPLPLIDLAFGVYLLSACILLPTRLSSASNRAQSWSQFIYRSLFYLIYLCATALPERFVVVLAGGLALYGMEQLYFWGLALSGSNGDGRGAEE